MKGSETRLPSAQPVLGRVCSFFCCCLFRFLLSLVRHGMSLCLCQAWPGWMVIESTGLVEGFLSVPKEGGGEVVVHYYSECAATIITTTIIITTTAAFRLPPITPASLSTLLSSPLSLSLFPSLQVS